MKLRMNQNRFQASSRPAPRNVFPEIAVTVQPAQGRIRRAVLAIASVLLLAGGAQAQSVFPNETLGTAVTQTVTVTGSSSLIGSTAVSAVEVLTSGASGPEFTKGAGTCDTATASAGSHCTESVTFTPAFPGSRRGAVVLLDSSNNVLGTAYISGVGVGGLDVLTPGNVITVAGTYRAWTSTQDNIPATKANLDQPSGMAFDGAGNMYIADSAHNKIRMVCGASATVTIAGTTCPAAGIITTVAGTGDAGNSGYPGPAKACEMSAPTGVALDGAGNLYIADTGNNVIRKITASTGIITTIAGNGTAGYGGDGLLATNSAVELSGPVGVTVDALGDLYIADVQNQRIRRIDAVSGIITTAAGNGDSSGLGDGKGTYSGDGGSAVDAGLSLPYAVAFDDLGNMFIPDSGNNRIRLVTAIGGAITPASIITTVAGTGVPSAAGCSNGATSTEELNTPSGVAIDPAGNIYIADTQDSCIRKANVKSGNMETIAVNGASAVNTSNNLDTAQVYAPIGLAVDGLGNVFYADFYYMIVDEIESDKAVLNFTATPVRQGDQSAPMPQTVENDGNATSNLTSVTPDKNGAVDAASTTCGPAYPFALGEDDDCIVGGIFAPSVAGSPLLGNIDVADNTINTPLDIVLAGIATPVNSTTIALASNPDPAEVLHVVTFTATVSTGAGTGTLTGTVTFSDTFGGTTNEIGTPVSVNSAGVAIYATGNLAVGVHVISATYNGDSTHFPTTVPATLTETIYEPTKVVITAAPKSPSQVGTPVTFTATVSAIGGTYPLDGSVTFTDSLAAFSGNTIAISGGVATFTTNALVGGVNVITATYTPVTSNLIQGSVGTLNQDVVENSVVTVTSAPNPSIYGGTVTFTVTVPTTGSAAATGKVNIVIVPVGASSPTYPLSVALSGNPATATAAISTLPVGSYNATATYSGDTNYASATSTLTAPQVVNQVGTATTLAAAPTPGIAGNPVAITATVTPSSGSITPTGTVSFTDTFNGATVSLGSAIAVTKAGTATVNPATLAPGTHSIVATYSGDTDDAGSTVTLSLIVLQATSTTTVTAAPSPAIVQSTITFTATVTSNGATPTGTVNFLANGSIALGTGTLNAGGVATVTNTTLAAGSYQITAVYSGDTDDSGSTSAAITEVVGLLPTSTNLSTATTTGANSQTILVATVENSGAVGPAPTGTVTFTDGTNTIGSAPLNADGVATLTPNLGAGSYTIVASYAGDSLHGPSKSSAIPVTSLGSSFNLVVAPGTVSMASSQNATVTVTLTSVSGFTDTIGLGCGSLPAGVTCHFSNISLALAANGTSTAQLVIDTNNPLGGGSSAAAMNKQPGQQRAEMAGLFLPFSLFMGWILWRFRKRHTSILSMVLILVLSGAAMLATGCIGFTQNSAAAGAYTIQVIGVGSNSDVTEYQNVQLTITQ